MDTRSIADWILGLEPAAIPPATAERVRLQLASVLASLLDGLRLPEVAAAREAWGSPAQPARRKGARKASEPVPAEALAPWWSMASIALDHDDYLLFGHTGHSAINVAVACGLERDSSLGDVLAAATAANELAGRLGGFALVGPHNGQMWTHIHLGGAVAAAARVVRDAVEIVDRALGLAFMAPPFLFPPAFFSGPAKLLTAALPIRQGLQALRLARATTLAAPVAVFGAADGLGRHFAHAPLEGFLEGFGEVWLSDTLAVKRVPGCAYVSAAAEAASSLAAQFRRAKGRALAPGDVERVELSATVLTAGMEDAARPWRGGPLSAVEVNFSAPLTVAVALLDGALEPRSLDARRLARDEEDIRAVAERVVVRHELARTLRLVDGVVRPMELLDALGDVHADGARRAGWELLKRYPGVLRGGGEAKGATLSRSPFELFRDRKSFETLRSVGQLVKGALGKRREGTRYSVRSARPGEVRFAASAGALATLAGEVFQAECEVPPGAPGAELELSAVVREKVVRAFRDASFEADPDEFVGRLLGAPLELPLREVLGPLAGVLEASPRG
ncbi:MAG: MmgE/PrpD family protein [Deltaproteobacteria bacterium]|nr:MmgE/PrpD family protein [Deltaproteobacteria bacterium]